MVFIISCMLHDVQLLCSYCCNPVTMATCSRRFEDIKMDVVGTVTKMLDFLKFSYNDKELARKLSEDFGTFKRYLMKKL